MNPFAYSSRLPGGFNYGLVSPTAPVPQLPSAQTMFPDPISSESSTPSPTSYPQPPSEEGPTPQPPSTNNSPALEIQKSSFARPILRSDMQSIARSSDVVMQRRHELIAFGDQKLQARKWTQAIVNYRNAIFNSPKSGEAHLRLAIALSASSDFQDASQEFKRAVTLDPSVAKNGETLANVFGPESETARVTLIHGIARWAKQDLRSKDRLFLLGSMLIFNSDDRGREILNSALNLPGPNEHITRMLAEPSLPPAPEDSTSPALPEFHSPESPAANKLPPLHQKPIALVRS
jgi:hypothetical protein